MEVAQPVTAVISFLLGVVTGFVANNLVKSKIDDSSYKNIVLLVILVMWTLSVAVELVNPTYKTNPLIHGLMGSIVGFFYKFEPKKGL